MPPRRRTNYAAAANRAAPIETKPADAPRAKQIRTTPYRITIDLEPALYEQVKNGVRHLAVELGSDVPLAVVTRHLFRQWINDPALAAALAHSISTELD